MADRSPVRLIDVTLRDAHQCLWATRMTTAMMRELAPRLDRAGFEAIDLVGGAVFDVCVCYLREDPWERMRTVASWVKETPLIIHTHCNSGLAPYVVLQAVQHGVDVVHTATSVLANGVSHALTERVVANLRRRGHEVGARTRTGASPRSWPPTGSL